MDRPIGTSWIARTSALVLPIFGLPVILAVAALFTDAPVIENAPAPRTVLAPQEIRVVDEAATSFARRQARESVPAVIVNDYEAQTALVQYVVDTFDHAQDVRASGDNGLAPPRRVQAAMLTERTTGLEEETITAIIDLSDPQLAQARSEAVSLARSAAAAEILEGEVDQYAESTLRRGLARSVAAPSIVETVVGPVVRQALRPTITIDQAATEQTRMDAAASIDPVEVVYRRGSPIVRIGETVTSVQLTALTDVGLEGSDPLSEFWEALLLSTVLTAVVALYLWRHRPSIWGSGRLLLLIATLVLLFTAIAVLVKTIPVGGSERFFILPVGAIAMLATLLFDSRVGVLLVIPMTAIVAYVVPGQSGLVPLIAVMGLFSIAIVTLMDGQIKIRDVTWQVMIAYGALAGVFNVVYQDQSHFVEASVAGLANGVLSAVMVAGMMPFFESIFGVITQSTLREFTDRNHPLLRELEQKAIGTYNHSVMVATLAARACREIGADAMLAEVMALYHDIGKIAKPYFFVENQSNISNPHDDLDDPRQSALIIQRHVTDGVEMATVHKLPPEIVDGIRTHHGTTIVAYFYRIAQQRALDGLASEPSEAFFRYKGTKPFTREQAVLMLSDCCEGAVRAASSQDGGMDRDTISHIVKGLLQNRVEDGQLDESPLTFADLRTVEQSLIEALEGIYHPRIQYPEKPKTADVSDTETKELGEPGPTVDSGGTATDGDDPVKTDTTSD